MEGSHKRLDMDAILEDRAVRKVAKVDEPVIPSFDVCTPCTEKEMKDAISKVYFMERKNVDKESNEYLEAVKERDQMVKQRQFAEVKVTLRNALIAFTRALQKHNLSPVEQMDWLKKPFDKIFDAEELQSALSQGKAYHDKKNNA